MAKKHKKKNYTTLKRNKHINKTNTLHEFINSLSNIKCSQCQSILATHNNRRYCGKCQQSELI